MRGLNMEVNTYNALIQSATLCHPLRGSHLFFAYFPGFPASASLRRDKPPLMRLHRRATIYRPSIAGALISAGSRPQGIPYKLPFIEFLEMPNTPIPTPHRGTHYSTESAG